MSLKTLIIITLFALGGNLYANDLHKLGTDAEFITAKGKRHFFENYEAALNKEVKTRTGRYYPITKAYENSAKTDTTQIEAELLNEMETAQDFEAAIETGLNNRDDLLTNLDKTLYAYSSCFPTSSHKRINWKVLKAMAYGESKLNGKSGICNEKVGREYPGYLRDEPISQNKTSVRSCRRDSQGDFKHCKYIGLFQMDEHFCESASLESSANFKITCDALGRSDIDTNVLTTYKNLTRYANEIETACPDASMRMKVSLLYTGHNNGPYAMRFVLGTKGIRRAPACEVSKVHQRLVQFYRSGRGRKVNVVMGLKKLRYGLVSIYPYVLATGATKFMLPASTEIFTKNLCPLREGKKVYQTLAK